MSFALHSASFWYDALGAGGFVEIGGDSWGHQLRPAHRSNLFVYELKVRFHSHWLIFDLTFSYFKWTASLHHGVTGLNAPKLVVLIRTGSARELAPTLPRGTVEKTARGDMRKGNTAWSLLASVNWIFIIWAKCFTKLWIQEKVRTPLRFSFPKGLTPFYS